MPTKHPGFREEKEWRVFHSPLQEKGSEWLRREIEVLNGVPQEVVKIKLFDDPDKGITGVDPSTLLNRVIIGPCEHPLPIRQAIMAAMQASNVPDPMSKIWMSFIPLRQR